MQHGGFPTRSEGSSAVSSAAHARSAPVVFEIPGASFGEGIGPSRPLDPGMGVAVGRRTVFRPEDQEDFGRVADRVAEGNTSLIKGDPVERARLRNAIACGAILTSGRHLQHGDAEQSSRPMEVFTNCSTAASSFSKFYLLLNGSGVGRSYDDAMMLVDWEYAPELHLHLSPYHVDHALQNRAFFAHEFGLKDDEIDSFLKNSFLPRLSEAPYGALVHRVRDSREGWAKAFEIYEAMTYRRDTDIPLVLDFSDVRPAGAPIAGMQGRPASGPLSLMRAFLNVRTHVVDYSRDERLPRWQQALTVDHYLSVEVQVGGARRAARMATKWWKDPDVLSFIRIKERGGLWTANHSIMVDGEFWTAVETGDPRARDIFEEATRCAHRTGEPGFINADLLDDHRTGFSFIARDTLPGSSRYELTEAKDLMVKLHAAARKVNYPTITNPCGEIGLHLTGGYCVLASVAPFLAKPEYWAKDCVYDEREWDLRIEDAVRLAVRFLVRVNTMEAFYGEETRRSNRIGIGLTGIHSWAWVRYGLTFRDLLDEERSKKFWETVRHLSQWAKFEANRYSDELRMNRPATVTTMKPDGSIAKLFALEEGAHLPARSYYLRWVQFKGVKVDGAWAIGSDPLLEEYESQGYPMKELKTFPGMTAVGFPTAPLLTRLGMGDALVTASEATPAEHYQWLRLLEKYWIGEQQGNQVSYTLKVYIDRVDLASFRSLVQDNQPTVRCCAILPTLPDDQLPYEYLPEEAISAERFREIVTLIDMQSAAEEVDMEHLRCEAGVCPL
jgi:ribonucleoside-triphosphate reductase (formate)